MYDTCFATSSLINACTGALVHVHVRDAGGARTLIGHAIRNEIADGVEAVLDVVDAHLRGFVVRDGADVSRQLETALVRRLDRRRQLRARDRRVGLERLCAGVCPVVHELFGVLGSREHMRQRLRTVAVEVRRRRVDPRPGFAARLDVVAESNLREPVVRAGGSHRGHAAGEVQPRERLAGVRAHRADGIQQMLMQPNDARNQRLSREIDRESTGWNLNGAVVAERGNFAVANDEGLIRSRRCARAVDDARVRQRDDRRVDFYVRANVRADRRALRADAAGDGQCSGESAERECPKAAHSDRSCDHEMGGCTATPAARAAQSTPRARMWNGHPAVAAQPHAVG